jgi:PTS system nitrogen regulatory IIA component
MLREQGLVATLRGTRDDDALYSLIAQRSKPFAA